MRIATFLGLAAALSAAHATAAEKVYKYDQFHEDLTTAAQQIQGVPLATQPGFAGGEAFGQIYRPDPGDYPVKILGLDLVLAAPPNAPNLTTHADIEIWNDVPAEGVDINGAKPVSAAPVFKVSTTELLNPASLEDGFPLVGNTALKIDFDYDTQDAVHPPIILDGTVRVMIRFTTPGKDMQTEWGTFQCAEYAELGACGCQNVGAMFDQTTTANANLLHYISPVGTCSGQASAWQFMEKIGVTGDLIMRMRAEVSGSGCTPACGGKQCGPNGCGGSCGDCAPGQTCDAGGQCGGACAPDCAGKQCGPDGCGASCGTCGAGQTCNAGLCEGGACAPACGGKQCGSDGCGGTCGTCGGDQVCNAFGACEAAPCQPVCAGKECGPDGCDGTCGTCGAGTYCAAGACVPEGGTVKTLTVTGISPTSGYNDTETEVSITGTGFVPGMTAKLGGTNLGSVQVTGDSLIEATVPEGLETDTYLLVVITPDDRSATLLNAFEVKEREVAEDAGPDPEPGCGDGICQANESCQTCPGDCGPCPATVSDGCSTGGPAAPVAPAAILALLATLAGLATLRRRA